MAIKAGQILHVANQFVIDRIQTGGPGDLNIPTEKVYELGNYQSVGIVRDVPDLSFNLECLDVDTEVEALLVGRTDPYSDPQGQKYELSKNVPIDIVSPWKTPYGDFDAVNGVAIPALALESASYRYGLTENAGETFTLNGDSIYYIPGTPWQDIHVGNGTLKTWDFQHGTALLYKEGGKSLYALSVSVNGERLTQIPRSKLAQATAAGDTSVYAESATAGVGIELPVAPATGAKVSVVYGSDETATFPQNGLVPNAPGTGSGNLVHQSVAVKPAAIRGKDIDVYFATAVGVGGGVTTKALTNNVATLTTSSAHGLLSGATVSVSGVDAIFDGVYTLTAVTSTTVSYAKTSADVASQADTGEVGTPVEVRWPDVQSASLEWRVSLEEDYEFGNARAVSREATDVPAVTGSVEIKPRSVEAFFARLRQITGTASGQVIGPQSSVAGALRIEIRNPESGGAASVPAGTVLKTHYVPDARFTIPGYSGQVQQKLSVTVNFESDGGVLETFKGARA